ncbi:hypothetical protein BT93_I0883 [Corymbia citriodora subsp. variegata]|nr:hypothetical protein BT93_I0883 [Corymbia citriodora subsp. variegata]
MAMPSAIIKAVASAGISLGNAWRVADSPPSTVTIGGPAPIHGPSHDDSGSDGQHAAQGMLRVQHRHQLHLRLPVSNEALAAMAPPRNGGIAGFWSGSRSVAASRSYRSGHKQAPREEETNPSDIIDFHILSLSLSLNQRRVMEDLFSGYCRCLYSNRRRDGQTKVTG